MEHFFDDYRNEQQRRVDHSHDGSNEENTSKCVTYSTKGALCNASNGIVHAGGCSDQPAHCYARCCQFVSPSATNESAAISDYQFAGVTCEETTQHTLFAASSVATSSSCISTVCVVEDDRGMAESSVSVPTSASTSTAMLTFSAPLTSVGEETSSIALVAHYYNLQPIGTQTKLNERPFSLTCASSSSSSSGLLCLQVLTGESAVNSSLSNLYIGTDGKEQNEENVEQMPCSILPHIDLTGIQRGPEESEEPPRALLSEAHFSAWIDLSAVVVHPSAASASEETGALLLPVSARSFVCNDDFGKEGSLGCYNNHHHNNDLDYSCGEATCNGPLLLVLNDNNNNNNNNNSDSSDVDFNNRQNDHGGNNGERNRSHSSSVVAPASSFLTQLDECGDLLKVSYASSAYFPKEEIEGEAEEIDSYDDYDDDDMHEDFVVYHHKSDCLTSPPVVVDATPTTGNVPNQEEAKGANHRKAPNDFSEKNYPSQKRMCSRGIPEAINCNEDENSPSPVAICLGSGASEEETSLSRTSPYTISKGNANSSAESATSSPSPSSFRSLPARLSVDLISSPASPVVNKKKEVNNEQIHIGNLSLQGCRPRGDLVHTGPKNDNDDNGDHLVKGETCVFSLGQNGGLVAPTLSHVKRRSEATGTMKKLCAVKDEKDRDSNTTSKEKGPGMLCRTEATRFRHSKQREQLRPSCEGCVIETAALESAPTPCPPRRQRTQRPDDNDIPNDGSYFWGRDPQSGLFMRIEIGDGGLRSPKGIRSTSPLSAGEVTNSTAESVFRCIVTPPPAAVLKVQSQPKPDGVAGTPLKFTSTQARTDSHTNVQKASTAVEAITTRPSINQAPKEEEEGGSAKQAKAEVGVEVGGPTTMVFADTFGSLAVEEIELEEEIQSDEEESSENRLSDPQLHNGDEVKHVCGTVHHMTTSPEPFCALQTVQKYSLAAGIDGAIATDRHRTQYEEMARAQHVVPLSPLPAPFSCESPTKGWGRSFAAISERADVAPPTQISGIGLNDDFSVLVDRLGSTRATTKDCQHLVDGCSSMTPTREIDVYGVCDPTCSTSEPRIKSRYNLNESKSVVSAMERLKGHPPISYSCSLCTSSSSSAYPSSAASRRLRTCSSSPFVIPESPPTNDMDLTTIPSAAKTPPLNHNDNDNNVMMGGGGFSAPRFRSPHYNRRCWASTSSSESPSFRRDHNNNNSTDHKTRNNKNNIRHGAVFTVGARTYDDLEQKAGSSESESRAFPSPNFNLTINSSFISSSSTEIGSSSSTTEGNDHCSNGNAVSAKQKRELTPWDMPLTRASSHSIGGIVCPTSHGCRLCCGNNQSSVVSLPIPRVTLSLCCKSINASDSASPPSSSSSTTTKNTGKSHLPGEKDAADLESTGDSRAELPIHDKPILRLNNDEARQKESIGPAAADFSRERVGRMTETEERSKECDGKEREEKEDFCSTVRSLLSTTCTCNNAVRTFSNVTSTTATTTTTTAETTPTLEPHQAQTSLSIARCVLPHSVSNCKSPKSLFSAVGHPCIVPPPPQIPNSNRSSSTPARMKGRLVLFKETSVLETFHSKSRMEDVLLTPSPSSSATEIDLSREVSRTSTTHSATSSSSSSAYSYYQAFFEAIPPTSILASPLVCESNDHHSRLMYPSEGTKEKMRHTNASPLEYLSREVSTSCPLENNKIPCFHHEKGEGQESQKHQMASIESEHPRLLHGTLAPDEVDALNAI